MPESAGQEKARPLVITPTAFSGASRPFFLRTSVTYRRVGSNIFLHFLFPPDARAGRFSSLPFALLLILIARGSFASAITPMRPRV